MRLDVSKTQNALGVMQCDDFHLFVFYSFEENVRQ